MGSDNEKEERKKNIIIKGTDILDRGEMEIYGKERGKWIKRFTKERLEIECSLLEDKWNSDSD